MTNSIIENKNKIFKVILFLSIATIAFWYIGLNINIYQNKFLGGVFEIIWLPNIICTFCIPSVGLFIWIKEKFNIKSKFLYLSILYLTTILLLFNF